MSLFLNLSKLSLGSEADFSNTGARAPNSPARASSFPTVKFGLDEQFGSESP